MDVLLGSDTRDVVTDALDAEGLAKLFAAEKRRKVISRTLGQELRRRREELGWSRIELADRLPSGVGDRTVLAYEHGVRQLTFVRFLEICWVLGVDPLSLARLALQRAHFQLHRMAIRVDLHALNRDQSDIYRPILQWARNTLTEHPDGVIELDPIVVKHLAYSVGCDHRGLINHLARFIPDDY